MGEPTKFQIERAGEARRKLYASITKRGGDVVAAKNREMQTQRKLEEAALEAHPSWREITEPLIVVGKRTFAKVEGKGPGTLNGLVAWFERTHAEEVERIRAAIVDEGSGTEPRP